jgi:exodeoxyribonuclease III
MLKVITWNVNSITVRLERLKALLQRHSPDVVCLQELKCIDEKFPWEEVTKSGYHSAVLGQKTYNGVAILSRTPLIELQKGFIQAPDPAARLLTVKAENTIFICAYVPNGQSVGSEKYEYKLKWLSSLRQQLEKLYSKKDPVVLLGDFNIAPDDRDVHDPALWHEKILCSTPERKALQSLLDFGFYDTYRRKNPEGREYSWWDYRAGSFYRNIGLRIDLILATETMDQRASKVWIDREERKGEKPSDHAPVIAEFQT